MRVLTFACATVVFACGNRSEPATNAPAVTPSAAPAAPAPSAEQAAEPAKPKRPLEIHSSCRDAVTLAFGDDPNATAARRTLAENGTIDGPRDERGNVTVWLLDAKSEPIAKVNVTRGMKKVEVGRSCRTLDAR